MLAFLSTLLAVAEIQLLQGLGTVIPCSEELQPRIISQSNPSLPQCDFARIFFLSHRNEATAKEKFPNILRIEPVAEFSGSNCPYLVLFR